jgi:hypothetical protein
MKYGLHSGRDDDRFFILTALAYASSAEVSLDVLSFPVVFVLAIP